MNHLTYFGKNLTPLLAPGETPLAWQTATYLPGHEDLGRPKPSWIEELGDAALGLPTEAGMRIIDWLITGITLVGWPGCAAQSMAQAFRRVMGSVALTNQRVLVIADGTESARLVWQCPVTAVQSIRHAPRLFQFGRISVTFVDGSGLMIMLGMLSPVGARRLVTHWKRLNGTIAQ